MIRISNKENAMSQSHHGLPCWYELTTPDTAAARAFYAGVLGWEWHAAGMDGFDYHLAGAGGDMVAGAMATDGADNGPAMWKIYFAVDDCDRTAAAIAADGGKVLVPPSDIPGTGRFAILMDPQGAAFGLLQPLPMADGSGGGAFDMQKPGHGGWNELGTTDSQVALAFYGRHFGWTETRAMEMGPDMVYRIFARDALDIGGAYTIGAGMPGPGVPAWLPYFGVPGVEAGLARIAAAGGDKMVGPMEVPGGAFIAVCRDPQGVMFAIVGPK